MPKRIFLMACSFWLAGEINDEILEIREICTVIVPMRFCDAFAIGSLGWWQSSGSGVQLESPAHIQEFLLLQ
jgi:hypothetical protein